MAGRLSDGALKQIFVEARTHRVWQTRPVGDSVLVELFRLQRWGPTSMNCSPLRIQFVVSSAAKQRLQPHLASGNVDRTMAAPATAILGFDTLFYTHLARLSPHNSTAADIFAGDEDAGHPTALRNSSLQGAYFIVAARALGLDCGPMSGFDHDGLDAEFWPDGRVRTNFLCNVGYADRSKVRPREPRFEFDDVCSIL